MNIRNIIKLVIMFFSSILHRNKKSKILFYHDVYLTTNYKAKDDDVYMGTPLELFKEHVDTIRKEGYVIVPRIVKEKGEVAIMFDDGFRGIWECRKWFYDQNIFPTIFLAVEYIGTEGMLTESEILELQQHGFNFECHSWSHNVLTKWSDDALVHELFDSKNYLSKLLNKQIQEICLPVGYYNNHLLEEIRKYGYTSIYSSIPGNYSDLTPGDMYRRNLCQYAGINEVKLVLRGGNESLKNRYEKMHFIEQKTDSKNC